MVQVLKGLIGLVNERMNGVYERSGAHGSGVKFAADAPVRG